MKLELDLNELLGFEYDEETGEPIGQKNFRNEVVSMAAGALIGEYRNDLKAEVREKVGEVVLEEIRETVRTVMAEPIQQRTPWGERKGEPATILEMVRMSLESFLSGTTSSGRDIYGTQQPKNLRELIDQSTREVLTTELRTAVAEAKKQINNAVTVKALEAAVEALSMEVKVR